MYENSAELAENKLLVLYVIKSLKQPISNTQLTEIILENNFINYFTLQQYITELLSSEFLKYMEKNDKKLLTITTKGEKVLSFFTQRISPIKRDIIDNYISSIIDLLFSFLNSIALSPILFPKTILEYLIQFFQYKFL